jgi:hypothetical protein
MNVKEAVNVARAYVAELFSSEHAVNMGLEEVEFDDTRGVWNVTIGFSRPWDRPETSPLISVLQPPSPAHRHIQGRTDQRWDRACAGRQESRYEAVTNASLILDASLLVLLVVGATSRSLVERHKRLKAFTTEDFDLLLGLVTHAPEVLLTPNTLTEASSLLRHIEGPARNDIQETFRRLVLVASEEYIPSRGAVVRNEFLRLGLTDAALLEISSSTRVLLLTGA